MHIDIAQYHSKPSLLLRQGLLHSCIGMVYHEPTVSVHVSFNNKYGSFNPFRAGWKTLV